MSEKHLTNWHWQSIHGQTTIHSSDITRGQSVEEVVETMTFAEKKSKEPQAVGRINEVTTSERAEQVLELLGLA